jgi:thymidylate kinase
MKVIAVEGISGSGKTTLVNHLVSNGFIKLPELAEKYDHGRKFPPFTTILSEVRKNNEWFVNEEILRCNEAKELAKKGPVAADRWFFSIIAYNFALSHIYKIPMDNHLYTILTKHINEGSLFLPPIVCLDIDVDVAIERVIQRRKMRGLAPEYTLNAPELQRNFLFKCKEFYYRLCDLFGENAKLIDSSKPLETYLSEVISWSKNKIGEIKSYSLRIFFNTV